MRVGATGWTVVVVLAGLGAEVVPAQSPQGDGKRAETLVKQLGAASFAERQKATEVLLELGPAAEPALVRGAEDPDPEIAKRCRELLPRVRNRETERRLAAFLQDKDDRLPPPAGWERFRKAAGNTPESRKLFAAVYASDRALLELAAADPKAAGARLAARAKEVDRELQELDRGQPCLPLLTALVLLASDTRVPLDAAAYQATAQAVGNLRYRPALLKEARATPVTWGGLTAFLGRAADAPSWNAGLEVMRALEVREGVPAAVQLALSREMPAGTRAAAVVLVGDLGTKEHVAKLAPLLADAAAVGTATIRGTALTTELRDVALAAAVKLSGQTLADYGFPYYKALPGVKELPDPIKLGFARPAERDAALRRWKEQARP